MALFMPEEAWHTINRYTVPTIKVLPVCTLPTDETYSKVLYLYEYFLSVGNWYQQTLYF